jgi:hypothetical protein
MSAFHPLQTLANAGRPNGMTKTQFFLTELAIVAMASVLIVLSYYAVLPRFFPGTATYSILLAGVFLAAVGGALAAVGYRRGAGPVAWATYLGAGVAVGVLVLLLSTAALVTLMGS